jgi:hypothetical protein
VLVRFGPHVALCRWEPPRLVPLDDQWNTLNRNINAAEIVGVVTSLTRRTRPPRRTLNTHQ